MRLQKIKQKEEIQIKTIIMSLELTCFESSFEEEDSRKFSMAHTVTTITGSTDYKQK